MREHLRTATFISLLAYSNLSFAGGPLVLEGPGGNTPVTYQNPAIVLNIENGKLGTLSNATADGLVQQALDLWNNVSTSTINLIIDETKINTDVNQTNFNNYLPSVDGLVFNATDNLNPVVYDDNGEIIDAYFGIGQSDFTIGFAASILITGSRYFDEGYAVINGKNLNLTETEFKLLITHEIGHFLGLDHSQLNISNQESGNQFCATSNPKSRYPVMYPFACRGINTSITSLHADDISAISALYPQNSAPNADFSVLSGRLTDQSGKAILGANIWVENTNGEAYSIVSDYLRQGNGFYRLLLPAGNYTLHVNSINTEFNAGSSVGPYSLTATDVSFTCPRTPLTKTDYEGNTPGSIEVITLTANQTTTIDFSLSGVNVSDCPITSTASSSGKNSGTLSFAGLSLLLLLLSGFRSSVRTRQSSLDRHL